MHPIVAEMQNNGLPSWRSGTTLHLLSTGAARSLFVSSLLLACLPSAAASALYRMSPATNTRTTPTDYRERERGREREREGGRGEREGKRETENDREIWKEGFWSRPLDLLYM